MVDSFIAETIAARRKELQFFNHGVDVLAGCPETTAGENLSQGPRRNSEAVKPIPRGRTDFLSRFMRLQDESEKSQSDKYLRDMMTNFVLAGRDTSAVALTWFFWLLSKHPDVEDAIYCEVMDVLSSTYRETAGSGHADGGEELRDSTRKTSLTYEQMKGMPYLHAALSESMRLYPPVPVNLKYVQEDDTLPDGTFVPAGTNVIFANYVTGRLENVWGPDCLEFKPERWLKNGQFVPASPFKYPIFNAGPRTCLGKDMAYLLMKIVTVYLVKNYMFQVPADHVAKYKLSATLSMLGGLPVQVKKRQ
eukprot:jgi/Mesen1/9783/ME000007S09841